jgi:hypothetical protein
MNCYICRCPATNDGVTVTHHTNSVVGLPTKQEWTRQSSRLTMVSSPRGTLGGRAESSKRQIAVEGQTTCTHIQVVLLR